MLTAIQQKLLQMMKEIDEVCRENDIHYSLGGGTAIGAIRHRGFIPWDDDIDLYMTRENWEKFKLAEREGKLPANRVIESAETDINYTNTFGRYVTTDSSAVHSHQIVNEDPAGHVIDVFVFDPLHIDNYWRWLEDYMLYSDLVDESKSYSARYDMNINRYEKYLKRCETEGKKAVVDELVESFTHMDKPGREHYIMEWGAAHFLFPASIFDGGYTRVPFEDTTVEIVQNYSEYLTWQYGDEWEYVPQHEGREGHDAIFSNEIPYTVVRDDYRPFVDFDEVRRAYIRRKKRLLKANQHRRGAQKNELNARADKCAKALAAKLEKAELTAADLKMMLDEYRYSELSELFRDYYDVQLSAEMIGRKDKHSKLRMYLFPQLVPIDAEIFAIALETLVSTERMSKARRLIDVYADCRDKAGMNCDAEVEAIREEIDGARELINAYSLREPGDTVLINNIDKYIEKYPGNSQILRLKLRLLIEQAQSEAAKSDETGEGARSEDNAEGTESVRQLLDEINEMLGAVHPAHGEILKYYADLERIENGHTESVTEDYLRAYRLTDNGFIRLEIEDLIGADNCGKVGDEAEEEPALAAESAKIGNGGNSGNGDNSKGLYGLAKGIYRKIAGRDDYLKNRAWEVACRTRDRVVLLEKYGPMLDELESLEKDGRWDELGVLMKDHEAAVLRNLKLELGLSVHPVLTRIQNELFEQSGRAETAQQIEKLIPEQHRKPIIGS